MRFKSKFSHHDGEPFEELKFCWFPTFAQTEWIWLEKAVFRGVWNRIDDPTCGYSYMVKRVLIILPINQSVGKWF